MALFVNVNVNVAMRGVYLWWNMRRVSDIFENPRMDSGKLLWGHRGDAGWKLEMLPPFEGEDGQRPMKRSMTLCIENEKRSNRVWRK
jgi:hypothetical protein